MKLIQESIILRLLSDLSPQNKHTQKNGGGGGGGGGGGERKRGKNASNTDQPGKFCI